MTLINGAKVTFRNSPPSSGESEGVPAERAMAREHSTLQSAGITFRDRLVGWLGASRAYWVPPNLLTQPPASVAELAAYAHHAGWTKRTTGPVRGLGVAWHRAVSLPVTTVCRYVEWTAQRPLRAGAVFGVWKLFILTGPGPAISDNVIRPALGVLAWVLL
ncbi:hypothetical protein [Micromonospora rubida]